MTTQQIADRLVELCRQGQYETAQKELYADDCVSIEPFATPQFDKETKGKAAIEAKGKKWGSMVEAMHALEVGDPIVAGNSFACTMRMDITMKEAGRMDMKELCVYNVKNGKVVLEEFFM